MSAGTRGLVAVFLGCAVASNLLVAAFGPRALLLTAVGTIGLAMTVRDRLHDHWQGRALALRMGALILAGAGLSAAVSAAALPVAVASFAAFAAGEGLDAVCYARLHDRPWLVRVNASNLVSATVDSLVFPAVAFGGLSFSLVASQFAAKVVGGLVWSLVLARRRAEAPAHV